MQDKCIRCNSSDDVFSLKQANIMKPSKYFKEICDLRYIFQNWTLLKQFSHHTVEKSTCVDISIFLFILTYIATINYCANLQNGICRKRSLLLHIRKKLVSWESKILSQSLNTLNLKQIPWIFIDFLQSLWQFPPEFFLSASNNCSVNP